MLKLAAPQFTGDLAVETVLRQRRSVRSFTAAALRLPEVSQLLWAAQGVTGPYGQRTAPSAGALYPLECYLAAGRVEGLEPGVYRYQPQEHGLAVVAVGDVRQDLSEAALRQRSLSAGAAVFVLAAVFDRTAWKYGERAERYVFMEIGHAAQNIALQAVSLGLGSVMVGAFDAGMVKKALRMENEEEPLYLIPIGHGHDEGL